MVMKNRKLSKEYIRNHNLFNRTISLRHWFMHTYISDKMESDLYKKPAMMQMKISFMLDTKI